MAPAPPPPERWALLKELQGTPLADVLDGERTAVYGWTEASYNFSSAAHNDAPLTWDDRANRHGTTRASRVGSSCAPGGR